MDPFTFTNTGFILFAIPADANLYIQSNLYSSNNDGSFTMDDSNSFFVPTNFFQ